MIEDGIFDGDIAIIRKCDVAERGGDIVAASVGDDEPGITLKGGYYPAREVLNFVRPMPPWAQSLPVLAKSTASCTF